MQLSASGLRVADSPWLRGKSQRCLRHVSFQTRSSSGVASAALRSALLAPAHAAAGCSHASVVLFGVRCPQEQEPTWPAPLFMPRAAWAPRAPGVPLPVSGKSVWRLHAREGVMLGWKPMTVAPLERGVHSSPPAFPGTRSPGVSPEQPPRQSLLGWSCWNGPTGLVRPGVLGIWVVESSSVLRSVPLA